MRFLSLPLPKQISAPFNSPHISELLLRDETIVALGTVDTGALLFNSANAGFCDTFRYTHTALAA